VRERTTSTYPQDIFDEFKRADLLGLYRPTEYDGSGAAISGLTLAIEEVTKCSNVLGLTLHLTRVPTGPIMSAGWGVGDERRVTKGRWSLWLDVDDGAREGASDARHLLDGAHDEFSEVVDVLCGAANDDVVGTGDFKGFDDAGHRASGVHDRLARADFGLNQDVRLDRHGEPFVSISSILPVSRELR
jgi:hypothetical protein